MVVIDMVQLWRSRRDDVCRNRDTRSGKINPKYAPRASLHRADNNSPFAYNAMLFMPAKTVIRFLQCDYASVTLYLLLPHAPLSA